MKKFLIALVITVVLAGGAGVGIYFVWRSQGVLSTDNARVTTTIFHVVAGTPGTLERFTLYEGRYVSENEIIGWVENGETMRAPFDGLVLQTHARQEQQVAPGQPIAAIGDINDIHIEANISETDIVRLSVGQRAYVTIDLFGNQQFVGYITDIARVTQAELTGQAMFFNTGGTFTRVTRYLPVQITLAEDIYLGNFIGVNARVQIPLR